MKRITTTLLSLLAVLTMSAQGWPANYGGVMLQAFSWDSYSDTQWTLLESQADELATTFDLIWIPQSGNCGGTSMGYDDMYWFPGHYNSSFGTEDGLKSMISVFKAKGLKTIADVVINHRKPLSGSFGFPSETYKGVTYTMTQADVVSGNGGTGNADTGEGWDGMPDLDHTSANVQNICKAYTKMLIEYFGYAGFRYDMVKGYSGSYTAMYNNYAQPEFSVGECWDGTATIKNWIDATNKTSAAFDFQFRYTVRNAINKNDWRYLGYANDGNYPLISSSTNSGSYRRYAVTFVENHDTQDRGNVTGYNKDPITRDIPAVHAYMLAMPGTPCVFLPHWKSYKKEISTMVAIRKAVGIHNMSTYVPMATNQNYYAVSVTGTNGKLLCVVGSGASTYTPNGEWTKVYSGTNYVYYVQGLTTNTAWADVASGTYETEQQVTLTAISNNSNAKLVYTTNGSNPTASSTQVASGSKITIPMGTTTLKVGVLLNGSVSGIITRNYVIQEAEPFAIPSFCVVNDGEVCAFFEAPLGWTNVVKCWAWNSSSNFTGGTWPGVACTLLGTRAGYKVYKWTYNGTLTTKPTGIIFNNDSAPQTTDYTFVNGGYYNSTEMLGVVTATAIDAVTTTVSNGPVRIFSIDGRQISTLPQGTSVESALDALPHGIYIINNKKYVK